MVPFCCLGEKRKEASGQTLSQGMKKIIVTIINFYQRVVSPDHGSVFGNTTAMRCRFYPSCSQYTLEAINRYGVGWGILKGLWRVLRCNPLSKGGTDPV